jgi:hypothetical protein
VIRKCVEKDRACQGAIGFCAIWFAIGMYALYSAATFLFR